VADTNEAAQSPGEFGQEVLQGILDRMELAAQVAIVEDTDEQVTLNIASEEDMGIVIGRDGDTLNALQLLVSVIIHRHIPCRCRVLLDAEGYRERRGDSLKARAEALIEKVKATGREALIESLHAYERRVIHLELADHPDVYTYSEGDGDERVLVISPKDDQDEEPSPAE